MTDSTSYADPPPELAPSRTAAESVGIVRLLGMLGLALAAGGISVVLANKLLGPRLIGAPYGIFAAALGMMVALYGALRETDKTVLRMYAFLGFGLILVAGALTLANSANFLLYACPLLLVGLFFLICLARQEDDPNFLDFVLWTELAIGTVFTLAGLIGGALQPAFLLQYGLVLTILGIFYLAAYLGRMGTETGLGYLVARLVGVSGLAFLAFGAVRSLLPNLGLMSLSPYAVPQGFFLMLFGGILAIIGIGGYSDNRLLVMTRRELAAFFYSPIAYLIMVGMIVVGLVNFTLFIQSFGGPMGPEPVMEPVVGRFLLSLLPAILLVFIVPAMTMRLFSEEKRTGSFEVLMGTQVSEWSVVLSKFLAVLIMFMLAWVPFTLFLIPFRIELGQPFDYRPIISFFVALTFVGAGFVSMGLFFSSLTKNQIVAAVLTFAGMLFFLFLVLFDQHPRLPETMRKVLGRLAFFGTLSNSIQGQLYLRDFVLHASMTVFWLYLTVKSIESRKWS